MPAEEERRLRQEAHDAGIPRGSARERAYVYSTLQRIKAGRKAQHSGLTGSHEHEHTHEHTHGDGTVHEHPHTHDHNHEHMTGESNAGTQQHTIVAGAGPEPG